jgi:hypothetical protein
LSSLENTPSAGLAGKKRQHTHLGQSQRMNSIWRVLSAVLQVIAYPLLIVFVLGRDAWRLATRNGR